MPMFNARGVGLVALGAVITVGLHGIPLEWALAVACACVPVIAIDVGWRQRPGARGAILLGLPAWFVALFTLMIALMVSD